MSKEMNRVFEPKEAEDKTQKDFVINTFKEMYLKYKDAFKDDDLSDVQLANKFEDNIMPGFFDFAILNGHKFGSIVQVSFSNYLSIKHGCWLNTIDYAKKYEPKNLQLAVGFIVHKDDLDKVNKDIENDFAPVYIDLIPHGFFVDKDGDIFDPTLGVNEDFHYFYKVVLEEIWKSFKYFYNNPKDWWVADFADWTKEQIRAAKESHEFFKFVGIEVESINTKDIASSDNTDVIKVEVRNERGELVNIEDVAQIEQPSERNDSGIVDVRNEKGTSSILESVAVVEDYIDGTVKLDQIPEGNIDDLMIGDSDNENRIPSDEELEEKIDDYIKETSKFEFIKTKSGHIFKRNEIADIGLTDFDTKSSIGSTPAGKISDLGVIIPTLRTDFINDQINNYGNLVKDTFIKGVDNADKILNTTTVFNVKGIGTLDSAAKTYYPFGQGEKTSRSKSAAGFEDNIPFYLTYFFSFVDENGDVVKLDEKMLSAGSLKNKKYSMVRTLSLAQPKTVYQYRRQIPNASIFNKPVKVGDDGKIQSTENMYKIPVAINEHAQKFSVVYVVCDDTSVDFVKNSSSGILESGNINNLSYFYVFKKSDDVKSYIEKCNDYFNGLENKENVTFVVAEFTNNNVSCNFKDLVEKKEPANCKVYIANAKDYKDFDVKTLDLEGFYLATNKGQLPNNYFGDFTFVDENKKSDTVGLDKEPLTLSDKFCLYTVHGGEDQEESIYKWIVSAPNYLIENGALSEVKIDEDYYLFQLFAITMKTEYPGMPKESEYRQNKAALKIYQWLEREYKINSIRSDYDEQTHMRRGYLEIERAIPAFSFIKTDIENDIDESKLSIESHKEWIKKVLCNDGVNWASVKKTNAEGFALNEFFVHYAIPLNVKLKYYLDRLQIIENAGEKIVTTQGYQGIVVNNGVDIGDTVEFKFLDNFIAKTVSDSVLNNIPEGDSIVRSQLTSVLTSRSEILERIQADVPSVIDKIVDEIDKNKSINPAAKLYVEKTENGSIRFYTKFNGQKVIAKKHVNFINEVFYKETDSGEELVVCSYDDNDNIDFKPVDEFCDDKKVELESIKKSYEQGDHCLYLDIANVVRFGLENGCYVGGFWEKVNGNSIVNNLAPYAFGVMKYNSILNRLNTYFKLPESLLPATADLYDLLILKDKLEDCQEILQEMHEKFKDSRYHLNQKTQDEETGQNEFKTKNINEYVKLYSGHSDESNVNFEQEEKWNRLCQYINFDIYPKIMEDEYKELRELAKSQQRLTQGVKLTVRLKEFATKVADIPFDFTTKSILFSALKYSGSARGVANAFSEIFTDIKNDTESNTFSDMKDVYADYNQLSYEDNKGMIKTSSAFKAAASTRDSVDSFLKQFDKLKDSYNYSFLNTLLYKELSDDEIWQMRDTIAKGFGFDLEKERESFEGSDSNEKFKECFVKAIKQLILNYSGYKTTKIASLYNRISTENYSLRDLSTYYKSRMSDIVGSLDVFTDDLSKLVKNKNSKLGEKLVNDIKIVSGKISGTKEEKINAMKNIIDSSDLLGDKYIWLLAKFDEMTNLYDNYKTIQKKLKEYINDEIKRINPSKKDLEAVDADSEVLKDEGLDEITNMFLKNIYSTWKLSMFDAFKKEQPDNLKKESNPFVFDTNQNSPENINAWVRNFDLIDGQKEIIVDFIEKCKKTDKKEILNVLTSFKKDQIENLINIIMKDDRETFSKSIEYIINVDGLNKTAESQNLYSLSSIHKTDNLSSNSGRATYSDDFVKGLKVNKVETMEFWEQFVKENLDDDKKYQLKLFVNAVLNRVGSQKDLLLNLNVDKIENTLLNYFKANHGKSKEVIKSNANMYSLAVFDNKSEAPKYRIKRLPKKSN